MAFLAEAYTDNLQQKLKDLHGAWMRCFDKLAAKAPVFKKKRQPRRYPVRQLRQVLPP